MPLCWDRHPNTVKNNFWIWFDERFLLLSIAEWTALALEKRHLRRFRYCYNRKLGLASTEEKQLN